MILQINTENHWVGIKPAKDNVPDSFLIYGGVNLRQFHVEGKLKQWPRKGSIHSANQTA